jgi:hypothetical protein
MAQEKSVDDIWAALKKDAAPKPKPKQVSVSDRDAKTRGAIPAAKPPTAEPKISKASSHKTNFDKLWFSFSNDLGGVGGVAGAATGGCNYPITPVTVRAAPAADLDARGTHTDRLPYARGQHSPRHCMNEVPENCVKCPLCPLHRSRVRLASEAACLHSLGCKDRRADTACSDETCISRWASRSCG